MKSRLVFFLLLCSILFSIPASSSGVSQLNAHGIDTANKSLLNDLTPQYGSTNEYGNIGRVQDSNKVLNYPNIAATNDTSVFVSVWDTRLTGYGSSNGSVIHLPLVDGGIYNFTVDWGDGNANDITAWNQTQVSHFYQNQGSYVIKINGTLVGWQFNLSGDRLKIIEITQWGNIQLGDSTGYFAGSENLVINATDAPNLTGTTTLDHAFYNCFSLGELGNFNSWNVSGVNEMPNMFQNAITFNQPLNQWDVSNVTYMPYMFANTSFNQPLNSWDVSSVTDMSHMFITSPFNQPLDQWDVSSVNHMAGLFRQTPFNQPINSWDVSNVTDMSDMFSFTPFNQPLDKWDVSKVTNMGKMFCFSPFNQPLSSWDISKVTEMGLMFLNATSFDQPLNQWDVSNVKSLERFLVGTSFSTENYDALLEAWAHLNLQQNVIFNAGSTKYSENAISARISIVNNFNWQISDGGLLSSTPTTTSTSKSHALNPGFDLIGIVMISLILLNRLKILSLRFKFN